MGVRFLLQSPMPPFTRLHIPDHLLAEVIAHAQSSLPNECCGFLSGRIENEVGIASTRFAIRNTHASPTRYLTEPVDVFAAFRAMRQNGEELLAVYHSHPTSAPVPSRRDIEENTYGETALHLIVGYVTKRPEVRAWWLHSTSYEESTLSVLSDSQ